MNQDLSIRIILENPVPNVDFGLQSGRYGNYHVIQKQRSTGEALHFNFIIQAKKFGYLLNFSGLFVQGHKYNRFFYINIGTYAGEVTSSWSRRIKVPFTGVTDEIIVQALEDSNIVLETYINGTAKDFTPYSGIVKPFRGWHIAKVNNLSL